MTCWKDSQEWVVGGLDEDCAPVACVMENRFCSSLKGRDVLAWDPSPKGKFSMAQGYAVLDLLFVSYAHIMWSVSLTCFFSAPFQRKYAIDGGRLGVMVVFM